MLLVSRGLVVVGESSKVPISPSLRVMNSKLGTLVLCERIYINGLPRLKHLNKFSHSLKLKLSPSNSSFRRPHVTVCFHRDVSAGNVGED